MDFDTPENNEKIQNDTLLSDDINEEVIVLHPVEVAVDDQVPSTSRSVTELR